MKNALIGYSGFVGSTLLNQRHFDYLYRSTNIETIQDQSFKEIICAGAPAQKWLANQNPEQDRHAIKKLIDCLKTVKCQKFILISTVDVFKNPVEVYENTPVSQEALLPYGSNRFFLEEFVRSYFQDSLIVRLPGLVGKGLRKNILFDFLNDNNLSSIDSRSVFQFYPMANLWKDLKKAIQMNLSLVHFSVEPIRVSEVALKGFGKLFNQVLKDRSIAYYDMRSHYADYFGGGQDYLYSKEQTLDAIQAYAKCGGA